MRIKDRLNRPQEFTTIMSNSSAVVFVGRPEMMRDSRVLQLSASVVKRRRVRSFFFSFSFLPFFLFLVQCGKKEKIQQERMSFSALLKEKEANSLVDTSSCCAHNLRASLFGSATRSLLFSLPAPFPRPPSLSRFKVFGLLEEMLLTTGFSCSTAAPDVASYRRRQPLGYIPPTKSHPARTSIYRFEYNSNNIPHRRGRVSYFFIPSAIFDILWPSSTLYI